MTTRTSLATTNETKPFGAEGPAAQPKVRTMIRPLLMAGCTPTEAANLAALAIGLRPVASGWSIQEIERLRFLRHLVASGRLPA